MDIRIWTLDEAVLEICTAEIEVYTFKSPIIYEKLYSNLHIYDLSKSMYVPLLK